MAHGSAHPPALPAGFLRSRSLTAIILLALFVVSRSSWTIAAGTVLEAEEQRLRQQREERSRQDRADAPVVRLDTGPAEIEVGAAALPEESSCFPIHTIRLTIPEEILARHPHLDILLKPWGQLHFVQAQLAQFQGRCIGAEGVNFIVRQLTALLLERGYTTTRIGIPAQNLADGTLDLVLIPGVVREIQTSDPNLYFSRNALPLRAGELFNLRALEQGLEEMLRLPSQDLSYDIVPGSLPGESDIVVNISQERPARARLVLDNAGTEETGLWRAGFSMELDGPFLLHDQMALSWQDSKPSQNGERRSEDLQFRYALPWGWWRIELAASRFEFLQTVQALNETFSVRGQTERLGATLTYTLLRSQIRKLDLQFSLANRKSHSFVNDTEISVQKRHLTEAEVSLLQRSFHGRLRLDLKLSHHWGAPWFGAEEDFPDRQPGDPSFRYRLETLDACLSAPITVGSVKCSGSLDLHGQYAEQRLFASEQLAIGNRYTVRGFDGRQPLSGERGWYLRSDLAIPLEHTGLAVLLGVDYGEVRGPSSGDLPERQLAGGGFGLRGSWQGLRAETFLGWPLLQPSEFSGDPALNVNASWTF